MTQYTKFYSNNPNYYRGGLIFKRFGITESRKDMTDPVLRIINDQQNVSLCAVLTKATNKSPLNPKFCHVENRFTVI